MVGADLGLLSKALQMQINTTGEHHPHVAVGYNGIGVVLREKREFESLCQQHNKAEEILEAKHINKNHKDIGLTYCYLVDSYEASGDHTDARNNYALSIGSLSEVFQEDHPLIGETKQTRAKDGRNKES